MKIRIEYHHMQVYDWNSTYGTLVNVRPSTAAHWRKVMQEFTALQRLLKSRTEPKPKAVQRVA